MSKFLFTIAFLFMTSVSVASAAPVKANFTGSKQCGKKFNGSFEKGVSNKCYKCPTGYKHAFWRKIDSPKSCYRTKPKRHAKAKYVGKEGCIGKSNFEYTLTGKCYQCPTGTSRSNFIANPAKTAVCRSKFPVPTLSEIARYNKAKKRRKADVDLLVGLTKGKKSAPSVRSLRNQLNIDQGKPIAPGDYINQTEGDRQRTQFMMDVIADYDNHNEKYDTEYRAVSYVKSSGGSAAYGFMKEWGYAMEQDDAGTYSCIKILTNVHSAGIQLGADVGEGVEIHQYGIDAVPGKTNGFNSSVLVFDATHAWTHPDGKFSLALAGPLIFSDGSVAGGGGIASLEAGLAYSHATTTKLGTTVPCDALVWGADFDLVNSNSRVRE
jgi:hypothetical protein